MELEIPNPKKGEEAEAEEMLVQQTTRYVNFWKAVLGDYKKEYGLDVPTLAVKLPSKFKKPAELSPSKAFAKVLVDHHLKRVPKAHTGKQYSVVYQMYEAGYDNVEQLIAMYDKLVESWDGTSWHTVWYKLRQPKKPQPEADSIAFKREELNEERVQDLKERMSKYKEGD